MTDIVRQSPEKEDPPFKGKDSATSAPRLRVGLRERLRAKFLGYDIFISYRRGEAREYAAALELALERLDLAVFRDARELPASTPVWDTIAAALMRSRMLILIGSPGAFRSKAPLQAPELETDWVRKEVASYLRKPKSPLICIQAPPVEPFAELATKRWLDEDAQSLKAGLPSENVLNDILDSRKFFRANRIGRWISVGSLLLLLTLCAYSAWLGNNLVKARSQSAEQKTVNQQRGLAVQARRLDPTRIDLALLLSAESMRMKEDTDGWGELLASIERAKCLDTLIHLDSKIKDLAVDSERHRLATAASDGQVTIWSADTLKLLYSTRVEKPERLAFSPDGHYLAIAAFSLGNSPGIYAWDLTEPESSAELRCQLDRYSSAFGIAFDSTGKYLVAAFRDIGQLWDFGSGVKAGNALSLAPPNMSGPSRMAVATGANLVAFIEDRRLTLAKLNGKLETIVVVDFDIGSSAVAFDPAGERLVLGQDDGGIRFVAVANLSGRGQSPIREKELGEHSQPSPGHSGPVTSLKFKPDGSVLLSGGADGKMLLWNGQSGSRLHHPADNNCGAGSGIDPVFGRFWAMDGQYEDVLKGPYADPLLGTHVVDRFDMILADWLPGDKRVISAGSEPRLNIWRYEGMDVICARHALARSKKGNTLAISEHTTIRVSKTLDRPRGDGTRLYLHNFVDDLAMDDGGSILVASSAGVLRAWDLTTLKPIGDAALCSKGKAFALSGDGRKLVVVQNKHLQIYNPRQMTPLAGPLPFAIGEVRAMALSSDGRYLAISQGDFTLQIMDLEQVKVTGKSPGPGAMIDGIFFSNTGNRVATAQSDGTIKFWDTKRCEPIGIPGGHDGRVITANFSKDDILLVTSGSDHTIRLWNAVDAKPVGIPLLQLSTVRWVGFSDDRSELVLSADHDRAYRIAISAQALVDKARRIANRNLTEEEWSKFIPQAGYHLTFPESSSLASSNTPLASPKPNPHPSGPASDSPVAKRVEEFAHQGLIKEAFALAGTQKSSSGEGALTEETIRKWAFDSLFDDAQEHFEYNRLKESKATLEQAKSVSDDPNFDPQATFTQWSAKKELVNAKRFAEHGQESDAREAFAHAVSLDPHIVTDAGREQKKLQATALKVQGEKTLKSNGEAAALELLQKANQLSSEIVPNPQGAVESLIITRARADISRFVLSGNAAEARTATSQLVGRFPSLSVSGELLLGGVEGDSVRDAFISYLSRKGHKAFAVGGGYWGWSAEDSTVEEAVNAAMAECKKGFAGACEIIAIDDGPPPAPKEVK